MSELEMLKNMMMPNLKSKVTVVKNRGVVASNVVKQPLTIVVPTHCKALMTRLGRSSACGAIINASQRCKQKSQLRPIKNVNATAMSASSRHPASDAAPSMKTRMNPRLMTARAAR